MQVDKQSKGRILVVDDEEPIGRLLELWLVDSGYEVRRASSFEQACEWMGKESFDLATLDIMMPVVDGLQSLRWLREYHPEVGVVMATALGDLDLVIEAMRLGAYSYMIKPFKMDLVEHELARAMERQRLVAENRAYQQQLEQKVEAQTRELQAAYARLEVQVRELEARDQLVRCQLEDPAAPQTCQTILQVVHQVLQVERAVLFRVDGERIELAGVLGSGGQVRVEDLGGEGERWARQRGLAAQVCRDRQGFRQPGQGTALPMLYQEQVLGVLWVQGLDAEDQKEERNILWRLGQASAAVLWATQVKEQLDDGQLQVDDLLKMQ